MAAVFTLFTALLKTGDHIVACRSVFGSTHKLLTEILPKWQIETTYVDIDRVEDFEKAIQDNTQILFLETPSNPSLDLIDIQRLAEFTKKRGILLVVDNCFATPVLQQPLSLGADVSIHSATKFIDGQGRTMGGIILASNAIIDQVRAFARHSGPALSPFNAWVLSKSLETLHVRMDRHCSNALAIAEWLETQPGVVKVRYPFLPSHPQYTLARRQMKAGGGIVAFELRGGLEAGRKFLNRLQLFSLSANLGDVRSIATHPASTTHSKLSQEQRIQVGITDGLVRLSIGLEHFEDLRKDLEQALI